VAARHQLGMGEGHLHELPNQSALVSQCSRFSHTLMRPDELPRVLARAFAVFSSERPGPVHIEIPLDIITADASHVLPQRWPPCLPASASAEAITSAKGLLLSAKNPCLIVGGGAVAAAAEVCAIAEQLNAPVINTVNAKGLMPPSHSLAVGGSPSLPSVRKLLAQSDVILAVGTEFGETDYDMLFLGDLAFEAKLIRIDIDAQQLCRNQRPDIAICGDARLSLAALSATLPLRTGEESSSRASDTRAEIAAEGHYHSEFQAFFDVLQASLPGLVLVGDSTLPTYYAVWQYEPSGPRQYFHSATGGGTLGYSIPAALGAKLGRPDAPVVALIGDGSAQFTLTELAAGVEAGLSVTIIVWNNQGYSEIKQGMVASEIVPVGVDIPAPDFIAAARALGCESARPNDLSSLGDALRAALGRAVPTLLEIDQSLFISQPAGQWY
jgi:acetolactate synthase-1/2/3 large subunit